MIVVMANMKEITREFRKLSIVTIGGGHGLSSLLRGLKKVTRNITAVVTVADNGGSSGALRRDMGILPPGDIRSCLTALADDEEFMTQVLQYRFSSASGVGQHNMGNLLLTALADITGSFEQGIHELASILAIRGKVTPSTLADIDLAADIEVLKDGVPETVRVTGESQITETYGHIIRCWIEPENVSANPEAIRAILNADYLLMGPGSLYTSIMPNLLVDGVAEAIRKSKAIKIYICNVMTQPGETDGYTASMHAKAIIDHGGKGIIDYMLVNDAPISVDMQDFYAAKGAYPVEVDEEAINALGVGFVKADIINENEVIRHDPDKLSQAVMNMVYHLQPSALKKYEFK